MEETKARMPTGTRDGNWPTPREAASRDVAHDRGKGNLGEAVGELELMDGREFEHVSFELAFLHIGLTGVHAHPVSIACSVRSSLCLSIPARLERERERELI